MVQRKAPHKIASQAETQRSHVKLERQSSSDQQQDTRSRGGGGGGGGGGGDLKKKLKLERSIRAADMESLKDSLMKKPKKRSPARASPNYMKSTSSSHARKEQVQVTLNSQTARNCKNLYPKKSSSSPSCTCPGLKLSRPLSRQPSLKAIRPLIVKNLIKVVAVNRAICSSTLKDSKFPEALDLNPGGTEAEGTSVMRVCPYNYCSLNGHRHEPLPPLRCFMSARRKMLKTQKSMKLKGLSSLRVKVLAKDKKEIDTEQNGTSKGSSSLEFAPPMEEYPDDFFLEIYTNENIQEEGEPEKPGVLEEDGQMKEPRADAIVEDGLEQNSEVSNEEVDVMMSFLEYVECDPQVGDADEEKTPSIVPEGNEKLCVNCYEEGLLAKADEGAVENESKVSTFNLILEEEAGSTFPGSMTECSECPSDCSGIMPPQTELSTEQNAPVDSCDVAEGDADPQIEVNQEAAGDGDDISPCGELSIQPITSTGCAVDEAEAELKQRVYPGVADIDEDVAPDGGNLEGNDTNSHEGKEFLNENEAEDTNSLSIVELSDSSDNPKEADQGLTKADLIQNQPATVIKCGEDDATEDASISFDTQSCSSIDESDESDIGESWGSEDKQQQEVSPVEGSTDKSKPARTRIRGKKITEDPYDIRDFNPRAPRFLDVEPDPEAEKVDLRHQMMDERKNSEEYLIDYALRNTVTKLAPARKRKVALLVEAFETVMPVPVREKPSRHPTSGFVHSRIMQACS